MNINIGYDFKNGCIIKNEEYDINEREKEELQMIVDKIGIDKELFQIVSLSQNYSTLQYKKRDIVRLKHTDRVHWIAILIHPKIRQDYIDNPLFEEQKNKNQLFWKSTYTKLEDYISIIHSTCEYE